MDNDHGFVSVRTFSEGVCILSDEQRQMKLLVSKFDLQILQCWSDLV